MENERNVEDGIIGIKTSHPAYGTISFNRAYGTKTALFGSSIEHSSTITLEVKHAEIERGMSKDWIFGNKPIVEVEMSYSQFAEAITSFGCGTGIPCTIRYTEKDGQIPKCDFVSKRKQFINEFKGQTDKAMEESKGLINEIADLFSSKKNLNKGR